MAAFEYTALDQRGREQKGTLEADSQRQVRQIIRDKDWTPLRVAIVQEQRQAFAMHWWGKRGISPVELATLTRQLATLIQAAMPVEEALKGVADQQEKRRLKNMLISLRSSVMEGFTLAQSLETFPQAFPSMYRATVAAGEHAGHLDKVLNRLADYTEAKMQSQQKIQQALLYPVILILAALGIVSFLLGYVVPDVVKVFVDSGQELPLITKLMIAVSEGFQVWWPVILLMLFLVSTIMTYFLRRPAIKHFWHNMVLGVPVVGRFIRTLNAARFASTLSILTRSGVSLVEAVMIASQVLSNEAMKESVKGVAQSVSEGASLNRSLRETGYFPPLMLHMIASGESTGELDEMLDKTAQNQQQELDGRTALLLGLFEPLMLVVMGGVVMVIVLAILLPILNMNQLLN